MSRAFLGILTRVLLVIFTFVLIVALAQLDQREHARRTPRVRRGRAACLGRTQDYFSSLLQGSLGEASSTSILGGLRRAMDEILLGAYPNSMVLVGLAVLIATCLGLVVGVAAAATSSRRLRVALLSVTVNVVGMLQGSNPERSKKFLLVGGHLDGVGVGPNGVLFPGANDNASGPAVRIEMARVLSAHRGMLKNSIIFAAFAGEEQGLVGSDVFVQNSITKVYRPDNIVALLNLDTWRAAAAGPPRTRSSRWTIA